MQTTKVRTRNRVRKPVGHRRRRKREHDFRHRALGTRRCHISHEIRRGRAGEKRRVILVGVHHGICRELTALQGQEAGGIDFPTVAHEHDAFAIPNSQRSAMSTVSPVVGFAVRTGQRIAALLHHVATVVWCFGRLHAVGLYLSMMPQLGEHLLHFLGRDALLFHSRAPRG